MDMTRYGYFLASEEHEPAELVRQAVLAEQAGFDALWISDHFHPWLDEQGQSSFVWSVIGAISQATSLPVTTAVGVGTGEALNEHVTGSRWPAAGERLEMLEEAVEVIRKLFTGRLVTHRGPHYTVETARLYSVPPQPPPVLMSGFGEKAIRLAARIADGYICVQPNPEFVRLYRESGGGDRPVQGGLKVCWGPDAGTARKTMHRTWRTDQIPGEAAQLLPLPRHFTQLGQLISEDDVTAPCGPDLDAHLRAIRAYTDAGFDEVYIGQVGPDQEGFFEAYAGQVLPRLRDAA
jgi:G6PDH family F420-dependent oxidoreductase